ncbi:DUF995 domain-containing protein [Roseobacter litoralis]|uniref:DUF995 domain-containing protein n=1 Tax=Roseobacter litoralis TaxID=42443 RepID=UPI0024946216|nr:DUF995 domain-containing protein [Roseobacter litoralis]
MQFFFFKPTVLALSSAVLLTAGTTLLADPKPKNSTPADPLVIHKKYNGNTWNWSQGASYWGKKGVFQAVWKGTSYGEGKWYVTNKGTLCYEAHWHWKKDGIPASDQIKRCWQHVVDADGNLWQRNHEKEDWYQPSSDKIKRGNKLKSEFRKIEKNVGS